MDVSRTVFVNAVIMWQDLQLTTEHGTNVNFCRIVLVLILIVFLCCDVYLCIIFNLLLGSQLSDVAVMYLLMNLTALTTDERVLHICWYF